jgi:hypothetical protein
MLFRTYDEDRETADRFMPAIKRILAPHFGKLVESSDHADCKEATDLIAENGDRIGCRVRAMSFYPRFGHQFCIRQKRGSGARTELEKIEAGWGDWFFYGFHDGVSEVRKWTLLDLEAFRWHVRMTPGLVFEDVPCPDGTQFRAFSIPSFAAFPPLVVAEGF